MSEAAVTLRVMAIMARLQAILSTVLARSAASVRTWFFFSTLPLYLANLSRRIFSGVVSNSSWQMAPRHLYFSSPEEHSPTPSPSLMPVVWCTPMQVTR
ncbi:hypothetical protein D9M68_861680 [compost metagenome]